ncbi:MAG: sensor histidine kinase KdpD [Bdellovibrionales bacterium]|nr:sensor histidine kinase KdpD [Bdellovibrionales bacterium]
MVDDNRPNPDQILKAIEEEQKRSHLGSLRVFLGMSAGVGKTYAMLREAQARLREGADVIVGIVETHGRSETEAMLSNLPMLPRKRVSYRDVAIEELDIDEILRKRPKLVLVDELAHTNTPGSRHNKRYQDVIELLDAGIDVYTTINIQHLESRKDLVEKITGVSIRETVPDSILERAQQIQVVDITPAELLRRLKDGKVYLGDKAERAVQNFFKPDSLTALREIALRFTAEKVDQELQSFSDIKQKNGPWQTNERLMVAVSHSPYSERLIRATRRLAFNLEAPWVAVHVDNGVKLSDEDQNQLSKNLALARELKAEVITTAETDIVEALRRIARQRNVTHIVVGRPSRRMFKDFVEGGNLLDRLVDESWEIDIHVIRQDDVPAYSPKFRLNMDFEKDFVPYWNTLCGLFAVAMMNGVLESVIGYRAVGFVFLLYVLFVGTKTSLGPVLMAGALSAIIWNFFFIPPRLTFAISSAEDIIMCLTYFVVALITGTMTNRLRQHEGLIREREDRTNILYEALKDITASREKAEFIDKVCRRLEGALVGTCGVVLRDRNRKLSAQTNHRYGVYLNEKEYAVAQWAFENRKPAGWSTETLSQSPSLYIPLEGNSEVVGVFVYTPEKQRKLSLEQENLLYSVCGQLGASIERHFAEKRLRETEKLQDSEKLHQTLLNSISHEMRTPLTAIMGAAEALLQQTPPQSDDNRKILAEELLQAGERLNRVIENLLDMTRLESGALAIKTEWHDLHDVVGVVLNRLKKNLDGHVVQVNIPDDLPLLNLDFRLFEHTLTNIIYNATVYTPVGSEITISVLTESDNVQIIVEDNGSGIPKESLPKLFEKFYRVPGSPTGGTGLGLSIAKSIVEFHKGTIRAENREDGGVRFTIELPKGQAPDAPKESV